MTNWLSKYHLSNKKVIVISRVAIFEYDVVILCGLSESTIIDTVKLCSSSTAVTFPKKEKKMIRTRLLWFSLGFTTSAAVVSHFVWKDLLVDRHALSSHVTQQFDALQTRISNLESNLQNHAPVSSNHDQVFPLIAPTTN